MVSSSGFQVVNSGAGRSSIGPLHGGMLPGRGGPQPWKVHHCCSDILQAGMQITGSTKASSGQAKLARMAKPAATPKQAANTVGSLLSDQCVGIEDGQHSVCVGGVTGFCDVSSPFRAMQYSGERCGLPGRLKGSEMPSETGGDFASLREGHSIQDEGVRRDPHSRSPAPSVLGGSVAKHDSQTASSAIRFSLRPDFSRPQGNDVKGTNSTGSGVAGDASSLSPTSRRCLNRFLGGTSEVGGNPKERSLENHDVPTKVRERGPHCSTAGVTQRQHSKAGKRSSRQHRSSVCEAAFDLPHSVTSPMFLEIFSGSGNLSRAVAMITGWPCGMVDIVFGASSDLRSKRIQRKILGWIRSGLVKAVHLGTPCNSFSRARDRRPGPPPLRSDQQPLGLNNLREADRIKVMEGNLFMRFSCQVCRLCIALNIPFTLENPSTSRLWLCPPVEALMRRKGVSWVDVDFCAFKKRWRKRTRFLYFGVDLSHMAVYKCIGAKRGCCAFSGLPHIPLMGLSPDGQFMTKIAEPYPLLLCRKISQAFLDWHTSVIAGNFWKRLMPEGSATMG